MLISAAKKMTTGRTCTAKLIPWLVSASGPNTMLMPARRVADHRLDAV